MVLDEIKDKINGKIAILWFWKEGKSALKFLTKLWATDITIHDKCHSDEAQNQLKFITWENYLENLQNYDLIIKSPWISPFLNDFSWLEGKITTPTEIFINNYKWKIIGITWTKWKSTTSTVTNLALQNTWFKTKLVWNIWNPVLDEIDILWENVYDYIIYEMSSYMLEWIKPNLYIWYINNIYDCHLDWHCWKENYQNAKLNILKYAKHKIANEQIKVCYFDENQNLWLNSTLSNYIIKDPESSSGWHSSNSQKKDVNDIVYFWGSSNILYKDNFFYINWKKVSEDKNILLNWPHNKTNISWVLAILKVISEDWIDFNNLINWLKITLSSFSGLPYRIENIWTYKWITFINDAMATTPDSTIAAINTFWKKIGTLFLWGQDSGFQFTKLAETIKEYKIPNLVILPEIWEKIFPEIIVQNYETVNFEKNISHKLHYVNHLNLWNNYKPKILITENMEDAVKFAYENSKSWEIVLLSTWSPFIKIKWVWNPYTIKWNLFNEYVKKFWDSEYKIS
jgi:UDP-N-acetylmuramoylalanine--D-glutamate ligase